MLFNASAEKLCTLFTCEKEILLKRGTTFSWFSVATRYSVNRPVETHMSGASKNAAARTQVSFCLPYVSSKFISRYRNLDGEKGGNSRFQSWSTLSSLFASVSIPPYQYTGC